MDRDIIPIAEVAERLGVTRSRVYQLIQAGALPAVTEPRPVVLGVERAALEAFAATPRPAGGDWRRRRRQRAGGE